LLILGLRTVKKVILLRLTALCFLLALPSFGMADALPKAITDADYRAVSLDEAKLGQLLFYDPILSGNKEVSCATCHHPKLGTADGLSLGIGDGGIGLGPDRIADLNNLPEQRIPRNAPALFNLGAYEFTALFHDGRIAVDPSKPSGLRTPLDDDMATGFASLLSAQTMFPVLSADEMAGHYSENDVSTAVRQGLITGEGERADQIAFTDISNAIAAFMEFEWRSDTSPFDAFLRGEAELSTGQAKGMELFYGAAGCADCHSGAFQTDHGFHAMAAPQVGPGKAARFESHARDEGRMRVTGDPADAYKFRTPSLRNVALTAPYGHSGAHASLASFVRDHLNPAPRLETFDVSQLVLPNLDVDDLRILQDAAEVAAIKSAVTRAPVELTDGEIEALIAFLESLTDPIAIEGRLGIPASVPSGLKVAN